MATGPITKASLAMDLSELDVGSSTLRTRSLRGWSTSSATPTASDASSNPSHRPQSRHTANTSVDLSNCAQSIFKASSYASLDSGAAMSPRTTKSSNFNIDDYVSSDADSFTEPCRPRGEGEEGLLFSEDGYGIGGCQLPGLFDPLPCSTSLQPRQVLQHTRSSPSLSPMKNRDSFDRVDGRRFTLDTAADSDGDSDADCETPKDISPLRGLRGTKRLSAILGSPGKWQGTTGFAQDVIIEERTSSRADVAAAVRLRKEDKARKRASGILSTKPRKARSTIPISTTYLAADGEASYADVE